MLDWTESLLIAAFFAVETAETSDSAIVYGIKDLPVACYTMVDSRP